MYLSTAFPKNKKNNLKKIPTELVICSKCKLAQLKHNYELDELYNDNYGYKSGVNNSMKNHLKSITISASKYVELNKKNIVLDIASNDGTLLKNYNKKLVRVGIDPVIKKYKSSYRNMRFIDNFFSLENYKKKFNEQKVKIITSIAVFYDVPYPAKFVSDISKIMHKDGIWVLEQSYFPHLVKNNAYDSICHEHLTYFTIKQINLLLKKSGLQIFNIVFTFSFFSIKGCPTNEFLIFSWSKYFFSKLNNKSI